MILCEECKSLLNISYRVFNWYYDSSDVYFDSLEKAENYYEKKIKEEPYLDWRLYEHSFCSSCDFLDEECLEASNLGEILK